MKNNIEKIVESVLIQNQIRNYDKKDLELQLQIHPNYPSFQSITDTLDYFGINNIAVEVPIEALDQLPKSFVSLVKTENSEEIVTLIKKENTIEVKHSELSKKKYGHEEFKEIWVPKVIAVESDENESFVAKKPFLQTFLAIALFGSLIVILANRTWDINQIIFLLISITGLVFSFFALRESLGMQSQAIHQFCSSIGNTNCGDVINNNSGKIFKNFTLSDAGFVFFGSLTLYQIFFGFTTVLWIPAVIGIPFVIYSIYSQAFIVKKWCALCVTIGAVSLGLAAIAIRSFEFTMDITLISGFIMLTTLFTLIYLFTKEKVVESKNSSTENLKLNQFKRDDQIFTHLLSKTEKVLDTAALENEIILGNPNSEFKIISLTNPMCGFCKDAFEAYTRVLKTLSDKVQIVIRLNVNLDDEQNEASRIALRLLEIYHDQGQDNFIVAYTDWFEDRTFSKWIKKYNTPSNDSKYIDSLKKQSEWASSNNLHYTPASIINSQPYPKKYGYSEFFHFMSTMLENYDTPVSEIEHPLDA